jgi:5-methylcytosine-specific restriction endonuclease McrA
MRDDWVPENSLIFSEYLLAMFKDRVERKTDIKKVKSKRQSLSKAERNEVLKKTEGKCHICGGDIEAYWEADHVLAHSGGGSNDANNYLPAHGLCNSYRWDYLPEEFHEILRLGVWLRTQIQNKTKVGMQASDKFIKYENQRISRRKNK